MKLTLNKALLITMPIIGIVYGSLFHKVIMPLFGDSLVHCMTLGLVFGFINYFVAIGIYKKYNIVKKSNWQLKRDLEIDKLTGLLNRRAFDSDMEEMSSSDVYSMVFIDIDNFRKFNNEFGHQTGDIVLNKVSQTIKANIRTHDKAYRYGGEEIVIVLKDCEKNKALEIAEKIRLKTNQLDNAPFPPITISLGISSYPEDGSDIEKVIEACDNALLAAKNSGKNRTIICTR